MDFSTALCKLLGYASERLSLKPRDAIYARNTVLMVLGKESCEPRQEHYAGEPLSSLLSVLTEDAPEEERERLQDAVMGALMLTPSQVEEEFSKRFEHSPAEATQWLYDYSVASDYVKKEKLDKNPRFTGKNGLIVTINKAKPEFRDPKKAVSGNSVKGGYPKCSICRDNEGYFPRGKRTLRTVSFMMADGKWFWQFSPYGYFFQHGIAVNECHTPMHVDANTFRALLEFADAFPHYFIGCNAPLPSIGGSVLAHDHFQGGGEVLPMFLAKPAIKLAHKDFPMLEMSVLDWFNTVVRLEGKDPEKLVEAGERVRKLWVSYKDEARGLIPEDENGVHHAVSPTVFLKDGKYCLNIILRSNITSKEYPDGVFHAHPEFHIIKKESIGLIEAQGLFILPGRLEAQLAEVKEAVKKGALPEELKDFRMVYEELLQREGDLDARMEDELADICERILKNTAVFKTHTETAEFLKGAGFYVNE